MKPQTKPLHISVVVATCDRSRLLSSRCLASITQQTRVPDQIIVVDDSNSEQYRADNKLLVENLAHISSWNDSSRKRNYPETSAPEVIYLANQRTSGASGAWNTALYYLAEYSQHTYVAFLDDDDSWHPSYLERCERLSADSQLEMVASDFRRIESCTVNPIITEAPHELKSKDFLIGNSGIQCSNLFCKWSVLVAAGGFDEALQCTTDRDMLIRIADLGAVRYARLPEVLLNHHADDDRERLSNRGSSKKLNCLTEFWKKYYGRMTDHQKQAFKDRAKELFDWQHPDELLLDSETSPLCSSALGSSQKKQHENIVPDSPVTPASQSNQNFKLYVGVITSDPNTLQPLLTGLTSLQKTAGCPSLSVIILDNGCTLNLLEKVVQHACDLKLEVRIIDKSQQHLDSLAGAFGTRYQTLPKGQVSIAQARTMLQKYLGVLITEDTGSFGWVLDDDMRVDDRSLEYFAALPAFRKEGVDVLIGAYEGASPNPPLHGLRVQLMDLLHNLHWLQNLPPEQTLPNRSAENFALRNRYPDYYYDLSQKHTAHLEIPYWLEPAAPDEAVYQARNRIFNNVLGILNGAPLTRQLQSEFPTDPLASAKLSVNRGGTTFILNPLALTSTPNFTLELNGKETRRSDMLWAIANRQLHQLTIKAVNFSIYHDRRSANIPEYDAEKINGELIGSALYAALNEFLNDSPKHQLEFSAAESEKISLRVEYHFLHRRRQLKISIHRIIGLSRAIGQFAHQESITALCDTLDEWFISDKKQLKICDFGATEHKAVQEFLINIQATVNDYANAVAINTTQGANTSGKVSHSIPFNWCVLPTSIANFRMYDMNNEDVRVVCLGDIHDQGLRPLVRIHSSCMASEVFGALDCDCSSQLTESMKLIATEGRGLIIHLQQEGRGHGLSKKIQAVSQMQTADMDTAEAFDALGLQQDTRRYSNAIQLLKQLRLSTVRLISNNPRKIACLQKHGFQVETIRTHPTERPENIHYLRSKKAKLGHTLILKEDQKDDEAVLFYHSDQPWGELSNFSAHSVYIDSKIWLTVEHYYQAKKFLDAPIIEKIRCCPTPTLAKNCATEHSDNIQPGWLDIRECVMLNGLRAKFNQHPDLQQTLLSSNKRILVEHTRNDAHWGDAGDGSGANRLGFLLMQVREELDALR